MDKRFYNKDVMMNLRVTRGQKDALDYIAEIQGLSTSKVMREVAKQYIATCEKEGFFTEYSRKRNLHNETEPEVRRVWMRRADFNDFEVV
jgi:hypothetical protein